MSMKPKNKIAFEQAADQKQTSLLAEFWSMLKHNKKYWLLPIVLVLLVLGVVIVLGSTAAAPFIYTLF